MRTFREILGKQTGMSLEDEDMVRVQCQISDIEIAADTYAAQFNQWRPFGEKPDDTKEKVLVQESDGSIGIWVFYKAAKFSGLEKLMWQKLPERYVPPMNYITQPFKTTHPSHE